VKKHKCYWKEESPIEKLRPEYSKQSHIEMKLLGKHIAFNTKSLITSNTINIAESASDVPSERLSSFKETFELLIVDGNLCAGSKND
jgi:hypothetical protein